MVLSRTRLISGFFASALLLSSAGFAGDVSSPSTGFLPSGTAFLPLVANLEEPRLGLLKEAGSSHIKLDIGAGVDFLEVRPSESLRLRIGVEFFTYALSTSARGLRLQIDAVDGFFGGHIVAVPADDSFPVSFRLRLMHLSAHFLDGHLNPGTSTWRDGREPVPFTRDFGEITAALPCTTASVRWRFYAGVGYATLIRPTEIRRWTTMQGVEVWTEELTGPVFGRPCNVYAAWHVTLGGSPAFAATHSVEAGFRFAEWEKTGLRVYLSYVAGREMYSQYYDLRRTQWGIGFAFDLR